LSLVLCDQHIATTSPNSLSTDYLALAHLSTTTTNIAMPTNLGRKVRRKNQVRLAFEPVNQSSSPAKGKMSPAKVRYSLRDSKQTPASRTHTLGNGYESEDILSSDKKSIMNKTPAKAKNNGKLPFKPLPTPAKSSQPQIKAGASSKSPFGITQGDSSAQNLEEQHDRLLTQSPRRSR
jgi:hypothetical protein